MTVSSSFKISFNSAAFLSRLVCDTLLKMNEILSEITSPMIGNVVARSRVSIGIDVDPVRVSSAFVIGGLRGVGAAMEAGVEGGGVTGGGREAGGGEGVTMGTGE